MKLDMQNKELQQIIMNLVGDICLYAQEKGLQDVRSVRDVQECFRYFPDDPPSKKNKFARNLNHRIFVGKMFFMTVLNIYGQIGTKYSEAEILHAVAEALSEICDENIKAFSLISAKILGIAASGNEAEMDAFMAEIGEFNKACVKNTAMINPRMNTAYILDILKGGEMKCLIPNTVD